MKAVIVVLLLLFGSAVAHAAGPVVTASSCAVTWTAPTTNVDASALIDLARYDVQVGSAPGVYPDPAVSVAAASPAPAPNTTVTWACAGISDGQHYARIRACDIAGNCSGWTTELPFLRDSVAPGPPTNVRVGP